MATQYDPGAWLKLGQALGHRDEDLRRFVATEEEKFRQREQLAIEREKRAQEREDRKQQQELERLREEARLLELRTQAGQQGQLGQDFGLQRHHVAQTPRPKLPKFDEKVDDIDAFLERFERFAQSQHWAQDTWAVSLSPLLTGKALDVYSSLPLDEANEYETLKTAILQRYQLTAEGFRTKFRNTHPERDEAVKQFGARLKRFFTRWLDMSDIERDYDRLVDLCLREQFVFRCSPELSMFLKERRPDTFDETLGIAQQYLEAHGGTMASVRSKSSFRPRSQVATSSDSAKTGDSSQSQGKPTCYYCGKKGHLKRDCLSLKAKSGASSSQQDTTPLNWRKRSQDEKKTGATAVSTAEDIARRNERDGQLLLASGEKLPFTGALCANRTMADSLPVFEGFVGATPVKVLRDSGCNSAAVKEDLVCDSQMTGKHSDCVLIDGTVKRFPMARITVGTPIYSGELDVMVMKDPVFDLIIGNVKGLQAPRTKDTKVEADDVAVSAAVETRGERERKSRPIKPLVTPEINVDEVTSDQLKELQKADDTLGKLFEHAQAQDILSAKNHATLRYVVKDGILTRYYYRNQNGVEERLEQIIVPKSLRKRVMTLAHEAIMGGHLGARKTSDRITAHFHWPGLDGEVRRFCQSCDICQRTIPKGRVGKVPLGEMPVMDTPFDRVAVDLIGPIHPMSENRNRYILTIVDYATRYPEAVPLKTIETERIAEALLEVFSRVGFPKEILSDQGTQFTSELMAEVARLISMKQLFTTPYNPKCNGLCERINGVLKAMLKKMCQERPKDWDRYLPAVLFAYREVPQASTGFSPFELLYGRKIRGPMDILKELWAGAQAESEVMNTYQYVVDLRNRLEDTCQLARENLEDAQGKYRHHYDKKARNRVFTVGQRVYLLLPTDHNKLLLQWRGPYKVTRVLNRMDYEIDMNGHRKIYHANLLKECIERDDEAQQEEGPAVDINDDEFDDEETIAAFAKIAVIDETDQVESEDTSLSFPMTTQTESIKDVNINQELTEQQAKEVRCLLVEFADIFSDVPGLTNLGEHRIELTTKEPIRVRPYPMPYAKRQAVQEEVTKMLKSGVIEPSKSEYNSPIVLVKKKDGTNRFCIDFRKLNAVTKFDTEPMDNYEDIIAKTGCDKVFSKLDFSKGYWQIPMEEHSKPYTAFATPSGSYQFRRNAFGLVNSGSVFNRVIRKLLVDMKHIDAYVDDVLPHTIDWDTHMAVLRELFLRIRKANLTLRPTKCFLGYANIAFTGHIVGSGKLQMEDEKIEKIRSAKRPCTKKQVRSFIGLAGFYRKFIPNFSQIAAPLTDLTRKGKPKCVIWTAKEQAAFDSLKDSITSAPILRLPDFGKQFTLRCDASNTGLGAILLQEHDDGVFPIAYASRKLLHCEQNYSVTEKECLAIIFGIEKFQKYLYGVQFRLETDHAPLAYLRKAKNESARLMRWALFLQNYTFSIKAIKGSENIGADYLSRLD